MTSVPLPAPLSEEAIRESINRWSEQSSFRITYFGDKIFIDEIVPHSSYRVALRTQYEERRVSRTSVPYTGGTVDSAGVPPGPWDLPVRFPDDFEDRTETMPVPHTESVGICTICAGVGSVGCKACQGAGQVICPRCHGRGYVTRHTSQQVTDGSGNTTTQSVAINDFCCAGHVMCQACSGNGRVACQGCAGTGQARSFDQVAIRFHAASKREVLDATEVPDELVGVAQGEAIVNLREAAIETPPVVAAQVDKRVGELLREAQGVDVNSTRVLFQHLVVERVLVHEVAYRYAGMEKRLWVYGTERHVHAPGAPWRWKRAAAIVVGVVGGIIGVIALAVLTF